LKFVVLCLNIAQNFKRDFTVRKELIGVSSQFDMQQIY